MNPPAASVSASTSSSAPRPVAPVVATAAAGTEMNKSAAASSSLCNPPLSSAAGPSQALISLTRRGRRRVQQACDTCKLRKRKCDGSEPCNACRRGEYICSYTSAINTTAATTAKPRRQKRTSTAPSSPSSTFSTAAANNQQPALGPITPSSPRQCDDANIEANSGTVFARLLGLQLGAQQPIQVQALGWNLDLRSRPRRSERNIVWIIPQHEWQHLFDTFVHNVHPLYGFLDLGVIARHAERRWQDPGVTNAYDHVLCGVAALGSVFCGGQGHAQEEQLVDCAREMAELACTSARPKFCDLEAWLLRTLYLRCCSSPQAAWMASCTTIHMIETASVHQESDNVSLVHTNTANPGVDVERQRLLFWLATLLNTWISFEYGRSSVTLQSVSCQFPTSKPGDHVSDLLWLFRLSHSLDPRRDVPATELEDCLTNLDGCRFSFDPLVLSQSNLAFTFYRRLRAKSLDVKADAVERVIRLGRLGLEACARLIEAGQPWWHTANVPFQFSCILLAMESHGSLSYAQEAIAVLVQAAERFGTRMPRKALETVRFLVQLCVNRKKQDLALLAQCSGATANTQSNDPWRPLPSNDLPDLRDDETTEDGNVFPASYMQTVDLSAIDWDLFNNNPIDLPVDTRAFEGQV